jgi:hypothetical protein
MGRPRCELCGRTEPSGALLKCESAVVCSQCAQRFELRVEPSHDPGSLGAVEVPNGDEAVEREPLSKKATLVIPKSTLAAIVRELDGQFAGPRARTPPSVPLPADRPRLVLDSVEPLRRGHPWARGIAASLGITVAVMAAFVGLKTAPRLGPSVPGAKAHEPSSSSALSVSSSSPPASSSASEPKPAAEIAAQSVAATGKPDVAKDPDKHDRGVQVPVVHRKAVAKPLVRPAPSPSPSVVASPQPEPLREVPAALREVPVAPLPSAEKSTAPPPDFGGRD